MSLLTLLAESPSPDEIKPWEVSPGLMGFIFGFFVLAVAAIPLFRSLVKHMRRMEHNAELRRREQEAADQDRGEAGPQAAGEPAGGPPEDQDRSAHREGTGSAPSP